MKNISFELKNHLSNELTTLAILVKITRIDSCVIGLTSHDCDIIHEGDTYYADGAITDIGEVNQSIETEVSDVSVSGVLSSDLISDKDIRSGLFDHARIDMFMCNWADLSAGVVSLKRGWLGEVAISDNEYKTSFLPFTTYLSQSIGNTYTPECRFDLGDDNCTVVCSDYQSTGFVTSVVDQNCFVDSNRNEDSSYFKNARLEFTSGDNIGVFLDVSEWVSSIKEFNFWLPPPFLISVGDTYKIIAGCDKRFSTCKDKFNNAKNFGGFPFLPGIGKILEYPSI